MVFLYSKLSINRLYGENDAVVYGLSGKDQTARTGINKKTTKMQMVKDTINSNEQQLNNNSNVNTYKLLNYIVKYLYRSIIMVRYTVLRKVTPCGL